MSDVLVEMRHLTKGFRRDSVEVEVLKDINLRVRPEISPA